MLFSHIYQDIISLENLLEAWKEFVIGKRSREDVQEFSSNLMHNIISLHQDLVGKTYTHSSYQAFNISDPKPRTIHKAHVRDRLLHHAIHRVLYPFFDRNFIADSFSCRVGKGTHRALNRFRDVAYRVSRNHTRTCWVLKCDIRKFFASIDHATLLDILRRTIPDQDIIWLLARVVQSFNSGTPGVGLPLGNLTSQLFANVYLNELDQFVKHRSRVQHYIRYADDFVLLSEDRGRLIAQLPVIRRFLIERLRLTMHPDKIILKTVASGVDFLGWVHFPDHRVLRTSTKRRMMRRIREHLNDEMLQSYFGLLGHGNMHTLRDVLAEEHWTRSRFSLDDAHNRVLD